MAQMFRETDLTDMDGTSWHYITVPLEFDAALALKLDLVGIAGKPLVESLRAAGGSADVADVDFFAALTDLPERIVAKGGPELVARLFARTQRVVDGKRRNLSDPHVRTEAYSGGNWIEFYAAARWVIEVNYGPFLTAVLGLLQQQSPTPPASQSGTTSGA
jgi:hypothetical protein